eukprot:12411362-Karenia_brevis.AAC.1
MAHYALTGLHWTLKQYILADRLQHLENLAASAQTAAANCDIRGAFGVVRKLRGFKPRPPKTVFLEDGSTTSLEEERQA